MAGRSIKKQAGGVPSSNRFSILALLLRGSEEELALI
jgi:hypothetical protein